LKHALQREGRTWNEVARAPTTSITPPRRETVVATPPRDRLQLQKLRALQLQKLRPLATLQVMVVAALDVVTTATLEAEKDATPRTATTEKKPLRVLPKFLNKMKEP
jgi:hypothetical protein